MPSQASFKVVTLTLPGFTENLSTPLHSPCSRVPHAYRQHATFYTDQYVVYEGVIPAAQHRAISKPARKTNHIERNNNTLRQRVSRLVREALTFSKKLAYHTGTIMLFICHCNLTKVPTLYG